MRSYAAALLLASSLSAQSWFPAVSANMLGSPGNLSVSPWANQQVTATYGATAPDSTATATTITNTASSGNTDVRQLVRPVASSTYTYQVTLKIASGQWIVIDLSDFTANAFGNWFDLTNGVVGAASSVGGSALTNATITSAGGGWWTCRITGTINGTARNYYTDLWATTGNNTLSVANGNSVLAWHPSLNLGASPNTYGATVTTKYQYIGFVSDSSGNDVFQSAGSDDGLTWTVMNGSTWAAPSFVNAPSPICFQDHWYTTVAKANDHSIHEYLTYIGKADGTCSHGGGTGTISTIATLDWSGTLTGLNTCFAGSFFVTDDGVVHLYVPCAVDNVFTFAAYETHPVTPGDLTSWTAPVNVNFNEHCYDNRPFKVGTTYWAWCTLDPTGPVPRLASSTSPLGPFTTQKIYGTSNFEGPQAFHPTSASTWRVIIEDVSAGTVPGPTVYKYFDCSTLDPSACTWGAAQSFTFDFYYRNGVMFVTPLFVPGAASAM